MYVVQCGPSMMLFLVYDATALYYYILKKELASVISKNWRMRLWHHALKTAILQKQ